MLKPCYTYPMPPNEAIDHDQIFKTLLKTFFLEFVELFFPELAQYIDTDSLEPISLNQQLFTI
ncbi:MAG: hypothetical protein R2880_21830 [Deinococcales bacterium]